MKAPPMAATLLMPEGEAALVGREGVGEDGRGVGEEHGPAHPLAHPHADSQTAAPGAVHPGDRQQDGEEGEDGEAEVVHLHPAEDVADPAQGDDQDGQDHHEAHEHPQHVAGVGRGQRVQIDAAEDGGQGDQDDRLVDEDHQGAQGDVGQGDPLVAAVARGVGTVMASGGGGRCAGPCKYLNVNVKVLSHGADGSATSAI